MSSQDDDGLSFPGQELLHSAGRTGGAAELQETLRYLHCAYQQEKSAGWRALLALQLIATAAWSSAGADAEISDALFNSIDPQAPVVVPWWVVQALAIAHYRCETEHITIDYALGLTRPGQGERSSPEKFALAVQQLGLAREVAWQLSNRSDTRKPKVDNVVREVAKRWGVKPSTVYAARSKYKEIADMDVQKILQIRNAPT
jgi:hypothetical protein